MRQYHTYTVEYKLRGVSEVKRVYVVAFSKAHAYDIAVYEAIPHVEGESPYSAWVYSVTYANGNYKTFNTFEGNPY